MSISDMAQDSGRESPSDTSGAISTPDLTPGLKPQRRAIRDEKQARNVIRTLTESSRERNIKNARIMAKYNSEKPYTQSALEADGLGWKSNFTTKPLPMLIDKVAPRFVKAVEGVKYLTNASLPETYPNAGEKTEAFRRELTSIIRARPGWSDFISEVSLENALFGFTCVAWLDEFAWMPKHFRQDSFFVPTGTKQLAEMAQVISLRETFLVHELFELIADKEAAQAAGWNVQNTVYAINNAVPENRRSRESSWERVYEDLQRESNVGLSHESGALVVTVWHLLATEVDGKVSHYILNDAEGKTEKSFDVKGEFKSESVLFAREDQFPSMADAAAFYSFQIGNGKLHGSKGIGREIYAMAAMLDRARNEVVDRLNLSGKILIRGDAKALKRFKMSVVGNALLIDNQYEVGEQQIDANVEEFISLDDYLTRLVEQMAGATTPKVFEGERVTKAAVDLFAAREEEGRDNILGRFLSQFSCTMTTIQRRICSKDCPDKDAKEMQERLLQIMSREELDLLAKQPVAETVKDYTELERQQVVLVAQEAKGNPLYNQRELERRKLSALVGDDFAEAVLLPEADPTIEAEQTRLQMFELLLLVGQATAVPVSPRDNHILHLKAMAPAMESSAMEATKGPEGLAVLQALAAHAEEHLKAAEAGGVDKAQLGETRNFVNKLKGAIDKLNQLEQQPPDFTPPTGAEPPGAPPAPAAPPGPPAPPIA